MAAKGILPSEFFYFLARNLSFISYAIAHMNGSSGRQRVSGTDIEEYEVRMPNSSQLIEFEKIAVPAMRTIRANSFENRQLAKLRDALLPKLMSGEIDASKIDLTQLNSHLVQRDSVRSKPVDDVFLDQSFSLRAGANICSFTCR